VFKLFFSVPCVFSEELSLSQAGVTTRVADSGGKISEFNSDLSKISDYHFGHSKISNSDSLMQRE